MLVTLSLALWLIGLFLVLKYRVHIHVNIETKRAKSDGRLSGSSGFTVSEESGRSPAVRNAAAVHVVPAPRGKEYLAATGADTKPDSANDRREVESALVGLGCSKAKARQIAARVCSQPGSFDELLRAAIREAA